MKQEEIDSALREFAETHSVELALLSALDNFAALVAIIGERGDMSEGMLVQVTGIDRLSLREMQDRGAGLLDARGVNSACGGERDATREHRRGAVGGGSVSRASEVVVLGVRCELLPHDAIGDTYVGATEAGAVVTALSCSEGWMVMARHDGHEAVGTGATLGEAESACRADALALGGVAS